MIHTIVYLVQILREEARMINPQQADAEEMVFLSWLNLETTVQSFALDHLFLPVELVLSFIRKIVSHRIKILENNQIVQTITTTFNQIEKKPTSDLFKLTPAAERKRNSRMKLILEGKYEEKKYNRIRIANARKDHSDIVAMEKIKNAKRMKDSRSKSPSKYDSEKIENAKRMKDSRSKSPSKYDSEKIENAKRIKDSRSKSPSKYDSEKIENAKRIKDSRNKNPNNYDLEKNKNTMRMKDSRSKTPNKYNLEKFRNLERNWENRRVNPDKYLLEKSKKAKRNKRMSSEEKIKEVERVKDLRRRIRGE